ncbi:glutamate 5-kinase [Sanguibacter antarcticus]|uniref:Glutamate 5-kinase n=1 Tax=Sanguibacter antarcticus TaxID=372484 RepID=A0A2A9E110_9MICO|nr:glutamate 5-kinase [Sanguibacter antarcticus]PFG32737.1 glutamate 5-kinase [Sanguibacter antarcticus]
MNEPQVDQSPRGLLKEAQRVVVKIGSSSLTAQDGHLDVAALRGLVDVIAARHAEGKHVVLVTSGAIAAGFGPLGLGSRPKDLATAQATAAVGQGLLVAQYTEAFAAHGVRVGQVLLTAEDTVRRGHYRNAQRSLERLLDLGVVPIVNENDAVATDKLRFGDNDRLAALVSHLVHADLMILLTDVDGLYDGPPTRPGAKRIREVRSPADIEHVEVTSSGSAVGTGGMITKLESVSIATASGIPVVLTLASNVAGALAGDEVGTFFAVTGKSSSRRRLWLQYAAKARGRLVLDDGAVRAVLGGTASLLPAGITAVEGSFESDDPVELVDPSGRVVARGLVSYDSTEIPELLGRSTGELRDVLGEGYDRAVVHRDYLVLVRRGRRSS